MCVKEKLRNRILTFHQFPCSILMFGIPALANHCTSDFFDFYATQVFPYVTPLIYPVGLISQTCSVYLTLLVTIERYVAVCYPLTAR